MNLLPQKLKERRKQQLTIKRLAAVQAVIFLLIVLSVWIFDYVLETRERMAEAIVLQMQDEKFEESEAVMRAIRERQAREQREQDAAEFLELPIFDTARLDMIQETLPSGVTLQSIDMDESGVIISSYAGSLSLSDLHREALLATGLVSRVQLSSASAAGEGRVRYELAVHWKGQ